MIINLEAEFQWIILILRRTLGIRRSLMLDDLV